MVILNNPEAEHAVATGQAGPRLINWLESNVIGFRGPAQLMRLSGGRSCPTYRLFSRSGTYVLRRRPRDAPHAYAHAVDREFRVLSAIHLEDVPSPEPLGLCEDQSILGSSFVILEFVHGDVFWDPSLPGHTPQDRASRYSALVASLAAIHRIELTRVELETYSIASVSNYLARQISNWRRVMCEGADAALRREVESLAVRLDRLRPAEVRPHLVHGDYRIDNVIFNRGGTDVAAVLDWELSTLGDPRADFAYHAMIWYLQPKLFRGLAGQPLAQLGIPGIDDYVAEYAKLSGIDPRPHWPFFLAFSLLRLAGMLHYIAWSGTRDSSGWPHAEDYRDRSRMIIRHAHQML